MKYKFAVFCGMLALGVILTFLFYALFQLNDPFDIDEDSKRFLISTIITGGIALWGLFNVLSTFLFKRFEELQKTGEIRRIWKTVEREINFHQAMMAFNIFIVASIMVSIFSFSFLGKDIDNHWILLPMSLFSSSIIMIFLLIFAIHFSQKIYLEDMYENLDKI